MMMAFKRFSSYAYRDVECSEQWNGQGNRIYQTPIDHLENILFAEYLLTFHSTLNILCVNQNLSPALGKQGSRDMIITYLL